MVILEGIITPLGIVLVREGSTIRKIFIFLKFYSQPKMKLIDKKKTRKERRSLNDVMLEIGDKYINNASIIVIGTNLQLFVIDILDG